MTVLDRVAHHQLALRNPVEAENTYRVALNLTLGLSDEPADEVQRSSGALFLRLGEVAEKQRHFNQARDYYLQALAAWHALRDSENVGRVMRVLSRLHRERGDAEIEIELARIFDLNPDAVAELLE